MLRSDIHAHLGQVQVLRHGSATIPPAGRKGGGRLWPTHFQEMPTDHGKTIAVSSSDNSNGRPAPFSAEPGALPGAARDRSAAWGGLRRDARGPPGRDELGE